jgi:hypothetical protein
LRCVNTARPRAGTMHEMNTSTEHVAGLTRVAASSAFITWLDFGSRSVEHWADWQRALWQPTWDLQARWLEHCLRQLGGSTTERGGEQLA